MVFPVSYINRALSQPGMEYVPGKGIVYTGKGVEWGKAPPTETTPDVGPVAVVSQDAKSTITGLDPTALASVTYGKTILEFIGGLARIGGVITVGPYFNGTLVSFGVSFGFATNPEGTRQLREISLDSKVVWTIADGFLADTFTYEFMPGTYTQPASSIETNRWGANAVAYRPQMMIFFEDLDITRYQNKIPYVAALIGDTTDGAVPEDGLNLGSALERLAYSPWVSLTPDTFETSGVTDIVQALLLAEDRSFLDLVREIKSVYRSLDILQADKLRVVDRGANVIPDITLDRTRVVGPISFSRAAAVSIPREAELTTIDPDADYMMVPSIARRPQEPVTVAGSTGKKAMGLPIVQDAPTRMALVTLVKYADERARRRASLTTTAYGMAIEPGDIVALNDVADGVPYEAFKCVESLFEGTYQNRIELESILRCEIGPHTPSESDLVNVAERAGDFGTSTYEDMSIGDEADDRLVVVFAGSTNSTGFVLPRTLTGLTIGGVAADIHGEIQTTGLGTSSGTIAVASLAVAAGITADIVATWSIGSPQHWIATFAIYGLSSTSPHDLQGVTEEGADPTLTINVPTDGALLAVYAGVGGTPAGVTWTGALERSDQSLAGIIGAVRVSTASTTGLVAQSGRTVAATSTVGGNETILAITFG